MIEKEIIEGVLRNHAESYVFVSETDRERGSTDEMAKEMIEAVSSEMQDSYRKFYERTKQELQEKKDGSVMPEGRQNIIRKLMEE